MDKLFLDANILFSAAYRQGAGLLKLWQITTVELVTSFYAIEEARRNLQIPQQLQQLENLLLKMQLVSFGQEQIILPNEVLLRDKDKPIFIAALLAKANYLITGDFRDFGSYFGHTISGVTILSPEDYLKNHY